MAAPKHLDHTMMRKRRKEGALIAEIAAEFRCSESTVSYIVSPDARANHKMRVIQARARRPPRTAVAVNA